MASATQKEELTYVRLSVPDRSHTTQTNQHAKNTHRQGSRTAVNRHSGVQSGVRDRGGRGRGGGARGGALKGKGGGGDGAWWKAEEVFTIHAGATVAYPPLLPRPFNFDSDQWVKVKGLQDGNYSAQQISQKLSCHCTKQKTKQKQQQPPPPPKKKKNQKKKSH